MRFLATSFPLVALFGLLAAASGCGESPTSPTPNVPFSQSDLRVGTGADAVAGKVVTAHYTGWLYDASKTDQKGLQFSTSQGGEPFSFQVGAGGVIDGMDQGVVGMKVGGLRRIVIPPSLGYGGERNGPIPANSTLIFEVELLDVDDPA
jgi:FKBP-type peptidyl-prolyl cis-trans isomerase FkpA